MITDIAFNSTTSELKHIEMKELGKVVVLTGQNGSGKSRLIWALGEYLNTPESPNINGDIWTRESSQQHLLFTPVKFDFSRLDDSTLPAEIPGLFSPFVGSLHDIQDECMKGFFKLCYECHDSGILARGSSDFRGEILLDALNEIKVLIKQFLNADLEIDTSGLPRLFSMPVNQCWLSNGQNILLQMAICLTFCRKTLKDFVIFFDEPETYLHPKAAIDVLETIRRLVLLGEGQLFLATHSLPIIAHFGIETVFHFSNGTCKRARNALEPLMDSMLGDRDRRSRLMDFIAEPTVHAMSNYMVDCIMPAQIVMSSPSSDIQADQVLKSLRLGVLNRVLDYGAGAGRILPILVERLGLKNFRSTVDYYAFNVSEYTTQDIANSCKSKISKAYSWEFEPSKKRYFDNRNRLECCSYFDIVLMCNVLHEIHPKLWMGLFGTSGLITNLIHQNGSLYILEDLIMYNGECAHSYGFIVMLPCGMKTMFSVENADKQFKIGRSKDNEDRFSCYGISKDNCASVSIQSIKKAFCQMAKNHEDYITLIRNKNPETADYWKGLKLGYHLQQYANISLYQNAIS